MYSQLAGVLAGFAFVAIMLLLNRQHRREATEDAEKGARASGRQSVCHGIGMCLPGPDCLHGVVCGDIRGSRVRACTRSGRLRNGPCGGCVWVLCLHAVFRCRSTRFCSRPGHTLPIHCLRHRTPDHHSVRRRKPQRPSSVLGGTSRRQRHRCGRSTSSELDHRERGILDRRKLCDEMAPALGTWYLPDGLVPGHTPAPKGWQIRQVRIRWVDRFTLRKFGAGGVRGRAVALGVKPNSWRLSWTR